MDSKLLEFIDKEKEISSYKLSMLSQGTDKVYKKRLLKMEQDFIDFPFDQLNIDNLIDLKKAMDLFRDNKDEFHNKWKQIDLNISSIDYKKVIENKILFWKKIFNYLIDDVIRNPNLLSNSFYNSGDESISFNELDDQKFFLKSEGIRLAKKRARVQVLTYSLARYINHHTKNIDTQSYDGNLKKISSELDDIFNLSLKYIFSYYNNGIKEVPDIINGTNGDNKHIASIYTLINYCDSLNDNLFLKRDEDIHPYGVDGKPLKKKFAERAFSIQLPMDRVGNEWVKILYCNIYSDLGSNLDEIILYDDFFNLAKGDGYVKAIPTIPVWDIISKLESLSFKDEILKLLDLNNLPYNNRDLIYSINNTEKYLKIDCNKSSILIPATRSEAEHIDDAMSWIKLLMSRVLKEYQSINWIDYDPEDV